jgi:putative ABC transport system permease protein
VRGSARPVRPVAERVYRTLLRLLPRDLRAGWGDEMTSLFLGRLSAAHGIGAKALVWTRALEDVAVQAVAEKWAQGRRRRESRYGQDTEDTPERGRRHPFRGLSGPHGTRGERSGLRRSARGGLDELTQDVRFALRTLVRAPTFTTAAVLTLAVGVGTLTAFFSVVDGIVLHPLPYGHPERLVLVNSPFLTPGNLAEWQRKQRVADTMVGCAWQRASVMLPGGAVSVSVTQVGRGFFGVLGVEPVLGHGFGSADHTPASPAVAMVTHAFWEQHLQGVRIPGASLRMKGRDYEVVGVLPPDFRFGRTTSDVWIPLEGSTPRGVVALARLRKGLTPEEAESSLGELARRLATPQLRAPFRGFHVPDVTVLDLKSWYLLELRFTLWVLLAAAGLVLLVACANVAALLSGRLISRRHELAVRAALGAGRGRIARQLLVEASMLGLAGAALGLPVAALAPRAVLALSDDPVLHAGDVHVGGGVLAFAAAVAVVTVVLFGLLPAVAATSRSGRDSGAGRGATRSRKEGRAQSLLVVAEVAVTLVLVVGSGLLLREFLAVRPVHPGFQIRDRTVATVVLPESTYDTAARRAAFLRQLLERVHELPGAPRVAAATDLPLTGETMSFLPTSVDGVGVGRDEQIFSRSVTPGYFELMGMPIVQGRPIDEEDRPGAPRAAVVNESAVRKYWPSVADVVGHRMTLDTNHGTVEVTVVGVVRDTWLLRGPRSSPVIFASFWQLPYSRFQVVAESTPTRPVRASDLRQALTAVDPRVPLQDPETLKARTAWSWAPARFQAAVLGSLAAVALFLAAVGTFAVLSHLVGRRTREVAVRVALGAKRGQVLALVFRHGMVLATAGVVLGLALSWVCGRVLALELFDVSPTDPATLITASAALLVVSAVAVLRPALRAARLDPAKPLREE